MVSLDVLEQVIPFLAYWGFVFEEFYIVGVLETHIRLSQVVGNQVLELISVIFHPFTSIEGNLCHVPELEVW